MRMERQTFVRVNVDATHVRAGLSEEKMSVEAKGTWHRETPASSDVDGYRHIIRYRENDAQGQPGAEVTLTWNGRCLIMEREEEGQTRMVFEAGVAHPAALATPYGGMEIAVHTHQLFSEEVGGNISISADYSMHVGEDEISSSAIRITAVPAEQDI